MQAHPGWRIVLGMRILILGGTQFVGRHFVEAAVARGHELTLFNRGSKPAPAGVAHQVVGDRNTDLARLAGRDFDAVLDTSAYVPRQVAEAAAALEGAVGAYLLVSTISVYADQLQAGLTEDSALLRLDDPSTEEVDGATYGGLKVLCEEALARVFPPERRLTVRPGIVVGPYDPTDRFTYWPARVAHGGQVLAPAGPELALQWIDGRDLADFMLGALERGVSGTYNAVSEAGRFRLGDVLAAAKRISGSSATITWVSEEFLLEHEVVPFGDLPFWLPGAAGNMFKVDSERAAAAGLRARSLEETVADTLAWQAERGDPALKVGLSAEREAELLELWRQR